MAVQWKAGDKVKLVTGGPEMVVKKLVVSGGYSATGLEYVVCQWFDNGHTLYEGEFAPETLVAVK